MRVCIKYINREPQKSNFIYKMNTEREYSYRSLSRSLVRHFNPVFAKLIVDDALPPSKLL